MVKFPNKLPFGQRFYMQSLKMCWSSGNLIRSKPSYCRPELEYQNPALMFSSSSHVAVMHRTFRQGHSRNSTWEDFLHCKDGWHLFQRVPLVKGSTFGRQKEQQGGREGGTSSSMTQEGLLRAGDGSQARNQAQPCRGSFDKNQSSVYISLFIFIQLSLVVVTPFIFFILFDISSKLSFSCVLKSFSHCWYVLYRRSRQTHPKAVLFCFPDPFSQVLWWVCSACWYFWTLFSPELYELLQNFGVKQKQCSLLHSS